MHRLLERLDAAASSIVPLAYLAGLFLGTAAYFSGIVLDAGMAVGLALAFAVEVHGFLAQRRVRATWATWARMAEADPRREAATRELRAHVAVLALLVALSMYNGIAFLAEVWKPAPGFLPAPVQLAIRGAILPVLFLASGFLSPLHMDAGAVLAQASQAMLHRTIRANLKQWNRRIDRARRRGIDLAPVAVSLMLDAGDTDGARRVELIARGLAEAERGLSGTIAEAAPALPQPTYTPAPAEAFAIDWDKPPTGPGTPAEAGGVRTPRRRAEPAIKLVAPRQPTRRTVSAEERVRRVLELQPELSAKSLAKAAGVSDSTASKYRRLWQQERDAAASQLAL